MNKLTGLTVIIVCLSLGLCGCEAFRKKFVRKPKREKEIRVVTQTHEYTSQDSPQQTYKKYFLFWRVAHAELIELVNVENVSRKKRVFQAKKIVENLEQMRQLLVPEKQAGLDQLILIQEQIVLELDQFNLRRSQRLRIKRTLEQQLKQIQQNFHYRDIQDYLIRR